MDADFLPLTVLIPEPGAPIEVYDEHAALCMAVVDRALVRVLGEPWDSPGVYVLLDRHDSAGRWGVYVGQAPAGIKTRLGDHVRNKDHWYRALLIRRDTTRGFNSAQVGWLEGRLYDLFKAAEDAELHNDRRPSDDTLPPYDREMLEAVVLPVRRILQLLGHDPVTADDANLISSSRRQSRFFGISLSDLVEEGLVLVGDSLISTNSAWPASASVGERGTVVYGGKTFPHPSTAASAVKQGGAVNGWEFWAVVRGAGRTPLATLRNVYRDRHPSN